MKNLVMTMAAAAALTLAVPVSAAPAPDAGVVPAAVVYQAPVAGLVAAAVAPVQEGRIEVDIDDGNDRGVWYTNPVWIAIGVIALIAIIALVSRGRGGTTVVK